jgi:hypothetical protein
MFSQLAAAGAVPHPSRAPMNGRGFSARWQSGGQQTSDFGSHRAGLAERICRYATELPKIDIHSRTRAPLSPIVRNGSSPRAWLSSIHQPRRNLPHRQVYPPQLQTAPARRLTRTKARTSSISDPPASSPTAPSSPPRSTVAAPPCPNDWPCFFFRRATTQPKSPSPAEMSRKRCELSKMRSIAPVQWTLRFSTSPSSVPSKRPPALKSG